MINIGYLKCCGIKEIADIQYVDDTPKEIIFDIIVNNIGANTRYKNVLDGQIRAAFYIFSTARRKDKGIVLKEFIEKNKLGKVMESKGKRNPNSGNTITVFLWEVNQKNYLKFLNKNMEEFEERVHKNQKSHGWIKEETNNEEEPEEDYEVDEEYDDNEDDEEHEE